MYIDIIIFVFYDQPMFVKLSKIIILIKKENSDRALLINLIIEYYNISFFNVTYCNVRIFFVFITIVKLYELIYYVIEKDTHIGHIVVLK